MAATFIVFDLDQTLQDSSLANLNAIKSCLKYYDLAIPTAESIRPYLGLHLSQSLPKLNNFFCGMTGEPLANVLAVFQSNYDPSDNTLFPGILDLLNDLRTRDSVHLLLATSKAQETALKDLVHHGIAHYFGAIVGSDVVEKPKPSADSLRYLINHLAATARPGKVFMIGDSVVDMEMIKRARECASFAGLNLSAVGVEWGANRADELLSSGAEFTAKTVSELRKYLSGALSVAVY